VLFANDAHWLIPEQIRPSTLIFLTVAAVGLLAGVLFKLGVVRWVMLTAGGVVRSGIRAGFRVWEQTLSWASWPWFGAVVVALLGVGVLVVGWWPPVAVVFAVAPLLLGLIACLAYMFIDVERYEVARGYKALHNPLKGQKLAVELVRHGRHAGVPLLGAAGVGMVGGFALLNMALTALLGDGWFTRPSGEPTYPDFVAAVLVHMVSVVDLLNLVDTHRLAHVVLPAPASGVAKGAMAGFKSFFTLVLLQQLFASVRRGKLLTETIADFWSPHQPIHDRARAALPQYGSTALSPLLLSLRAADTLTHEQRERLPEILATLGPSAVPELLDRLGDPNEHVRAVAAAALGHLRAGTAVCRLAMLSTDPSDLVRLSAAAALGQIGCKGWPPAALRGEKGRWYRLRFWVRKPGGPVAEADPDVAVTQALRNGLKDASAAVRGAAAEAVGQLTAKRMPELFPLLVTGTADDDETVRVRATLAVGAVGGDHPETVPVLTRLLADPAAAVRAAAATAFAPLKGKAEPALSALVSLLEDRDEAVRAAASATVSKLGTLSVAAANTLAEGLASDDTLRRARTAEALGDIGVAAADVAPMLAEAAEDDNDRVRAKAVEALGKIGEAAADVAVPKLVRALKDQDDWVIALAAEALGEMGDSAADAALPALVRSLAHANPQVRANAAEAIGKLGPAAVGVVAALETAAVNDADTAVRRAAVEALAAVGRPRASTLAVVRDALSDPDPALREAAVATFGAWGVVSEVVRQQLVALLEDANDGVKLRALQVLPRLAGEGADVIDAFTRRLAEDDSHAVQAEAARALGQLGPAAAAAGPTLLRAVQTGEAGVRVEAMRAVVMIRPPEAADAFCAGLHDAEVAVRKVASAGWRKADDIPESAVPVLVEALHDPDTQVRANAAHAVGRMNPVPADAVPLLAECLKESDAGLRLNAALALQAGGPAALDALRPLLADANPRLRLIAARRLLDDQPDDTAAAVAVAAAVADASASVRKSADELLDTLKPEAVPTVLTALRERAEGEPESDAADELATAVGRLEARLPAPEVVIGVPTPDVHPVVSA
jgi:HEAT repeat protein